MLDAETKMKTWYFRLFGLINDDLHFEQRKQYPMPKPAAAVRMTVVDQLKQYVLPVFQNLFPKCQGVGWGL